MSDGLTCDCHGKGWAGLPAMELDGSDWPLSTAAALLGLPERDLRDLVRIAGLPPSGTAKMATFARSGRHPRVYPGAGLITICEAIFAVRQQLGTQDPG